MKILLLILTILFCAGCAKPDYGGPDAPPTSPNQMVFEKSRCRVSLKWITPPTAEASGELELRFAALDGAKQARDPGAEVFVLLWMSSMGHGSAPTKTRREDEGVYRVTNVFFIMPGAWEIRVQLKNAGGIFEELAIPYAFGGV